MIELFTIKTACAVRPRKRAELFHGRRMPGQTGHAPPHSARSASGIYMAEILLEMISKSFGDHAVIKDLSAAVRDGECFTLIGPSGCGKTILLRIMAGFETLDAGRMSIVGRSCGRCRQRHAAARTTQLPGVRR